MSEKFSQQSRRRFVKTGALTSGALALGLVGNAAAQQTETPTGDGGDGDEEFRRAAMFSDEFYSGAVFRVVSPNLENQPLVTDPGGLQDWNVRVIEYFNTNEENYLFLPPDAQVQEGDLYVFDDAFTPFDDVDVDDEDLVVAPYRPLGQEDFPFELEEGTDFELVDEGGGEAAVRPQDFYSGGLFRITSGPQGWVPADVADSGLFTDYDTVHAEYLGTNDEFLFFPQEGAAVEQGRLYVMWDEFEFLDPVGNLVATEFDVVNEGSLTVDDEFL